MNPYRILIVENEAIVAMDMQDRLSRMGYDLAGTAATGEQALALSEQHRPDLVLMDIRLQGAMDGIAAAQEIRRRFRIPTIFLTAYSEDATLERAKLAEPFAFLLKPFDDRELRSSIEIALYKHAAMEEIRRLNRLYDLLSQVNQLVVRATSREDLLPAICRLVVERAQIDLAWIGWLDTATARIVPIAHFGKAGQTPARMKITDADQPLGCGNPGRAVTTERPFICNDCGGGVDSDPASAPAPSGFGFRSCASFPLRFQGRVCGALNLCVNEPEFFRQREINLLEEITLNISFALDKIEGDFQRRQTDEALRESEERYRLLFEESPDAIGIYQDGKLVFVNSTGVRLLGATTREELLGRSSEQGLHPEDQAAAVDRLRRRLTGETGLYPAEARYLRLDGTVVPVEVTASPITFDGQPAVQFIARDISLRKAHEAEIERLNRLYATLSQVNQTIVRRQSREELLADICRVAVEFGRFKAAWIGRKVADSETVTTVAHHASGPDAALARPGYDGRCGVMAEAVRTGRPCLCIDAQTDERAACCRQVLAGLGVQACSAFPLRLRGEVCGGFSICSIEPSFFNAAEIRLLEEVTSAISFALDRLDQKEQRQRAEEALLASELRYRRLFEAAKDGILILDAETGMVVDVNPFLVKLLGFSHDAFLGKAIWELGFLKDIIANRANFAELQQQEYIRYDDKPLETTDGRRIDVEFVSNVYQVKHHKVIQCNIRDISERKRAEAQLRKLSRAVAQSPASVVITDLLGNIEYVNPKFEQVTGYALAEVLGKNPRVLKSGEMPAEAYAELWRTITARGEWSGEFHNRRKDGSLYWENAVISGIRDEKGRITHFLAVKEDITDRKRTEVELREREERLRLAMEAANMGTWDRDLLTNALRWSDTEERLMGYAPGAFPGTSEAFMELVHPDSMSVLLAAQQRVRTGDGVYHAELRFCCKDGRERWGLLCGRKVVDESGRAVRIVGVDMDITERKRIEEALRENEALLRESQVIAGLGSYVLEIATGRWTSSDVLDELFGIDKAYNRTVEGWAALIHPDDRAMMADYFENEVLDRRQFFNKEYRIVRHNDQAERWVCGLGRLELDAQGRPVKMRGTIQDITPRKRLEQERAAMEAQLQQQQKLESIGTLAGGVAHEINNPINGIMNYAQIIQDRLEAGSPLAEYTREILHETQRVAAIVRNLLTFSRDEKQSRSPARMADIVEGTLSLIRTVIRHDQITLNVDVPADLPDLKCRSQQLQQVLMNLMTNARDALNERHPGHDPDKVLSVGARLFEKEGRRWIRLTVEDRGTGIAPAVRERMFDPFYTTKSRDKGTGLGLAISHGIVKEHGGEMIVESEPGRFTRLHVDLPVETGENL